MGLEHYDQSMELDTTTGKPMKRTSVVGFGKAVAVVPNDATNIDVTKGLYLGVAGDVAVTMADGTNVTFKALSAGVVHQLNVKVVKATGTVATNILALY